MLGCQFCPDNLWLLGTWGPNPMRSAFYVAQGSTCNTVYIEGLRSTSACARVIEKYRDICCNPKSNATQVPQMTPVSQSGTLYPRGNNSLCNICIDGRVPTKRYTIICSTYLRKSFSCVQLYDYGKTGNIGDVICYPLQVYVRDVCGCVL